MNTYYGRDLDRATSAEEAYRILRKACNDINVSDYTCQRLRKVFDKTYGSDAYQRIQEAVDAIGKEASNA